MMKSVMQSQTTRAAQLMSRSLITTVKANAAALNPRFGSSSSSINNGETESDNEQKMYPVFVHNLSNVVLKRLQSKHADWLVDQGLHMGLRLNANGTFCLRFPSEKTSPPKQGITAISNGRIWTSYDSSTKEHWLTVKHEDLAGRFLLSDNRDIKTQVEEATFPERLHAVVDKMVHIVNERSD